MRKPLTEAEKQYIYKQKMRGRTLAEIAEELNSSYGTVRKWWRHQRDGTKPQPRGRPTEGILSTYPKEVRDKAVELKEARPGRGPERLRLDLQAALKLDETELPSSSRLAALFRRACPEAVKAYRRRSYPSQPPQPAKYPHHKWQIDGKEYVPIAATEVATVLNIRDPYTGAMIASQAFLTTTPDHCRKVSLLEVQESLRHAFQAWGLPRLVQTDHETVYVGAPERYFPSPFTLWLVGLGIEHSPSRRGRATDQGAVERQHRTLGDWVWRDETFATVAALQQALDDNRQLYNERFPAEAGHCQGQAPLVAFPQARHSARNFHPALEWELFDRQRVDTFLAQQLWSRTVDSNGVTRIAGHRYYLGRDYRAQSVTVTFLPQTRSFRFQTADGAVIKEMQAVGLDKADIIGRIPADADWPRLSQPFQLPLQLQGV